MIMPSGSTQSRVMIVTDCPSYTDIQKQEFLSGSDGMELNRMLGEAGLMRSECFITSVVRTMIPSCTLETVIAQTKASITPRHKPYFDKMVLEPFLSGAALLIKEIDLVKPRVILALGSGALFALLGKWGTKNWRGSELRYTSPGGHECLVIPTYPPKYILAVWKDRGIAVQDLRRVKAASLRETLPPPIPYSFLVRPSFSAVVSRLNDLLRRVSLAPTKLSVDIETRGGHTACTGIAWSKTEAICIPHLVAGNQSYWREEEEAFILHLMWRLLTHENAEVIGQNFLYDSQYFWRWFHFIPNFKRDTMIANHSMFSNLPKGLDYLSSTYCEQHVYWKDESKDWDPKLGEDQLWVYNCKDCVITFEVDEEQQRTISEMAASGWPELPAIHDFQQSLFHPVLETMNVGLRVSDASREGVSKTLRTQIEASQLWIESVVGHPLNIKSPLQMKDFFYRELAQKEIISRKTHKPTCDDSAIERIAEREPLLRPLVSKISEQRSAGVMLATFAESETDIDGRMRCSFNICGTETYRFASSKNAFWSGMNLQNVPAELRHFFIPDDGMEYFDLDLDSADLRIVVWESDCTEMKQMFAEGLKPYVEVAKEYYRDPTITKHHPSYKLFKALCHGTNYLGTAAGLAGRIGLLAQEVDRIQKWYYGKFPQIQDWQKDICAQVSGRKYIQNIYGYREYFFDRIEGTIFNQAVAWIPQSTVACLINRGYRNIYDNLKQVQVLLQVHDSLAGQYPTYLRDFARRRIVEECSSALPYDEPLVIPVGIVSSEKSWGGCK